MKKISLCSILLLTSNICLANGTKSNTKTDEGMRKYVRVQEEKVYSCGATGDSVFSGWDGLYRSDVRAKLKKTNYDFTSVKNLSD